jgi:membrane protein DedA with SNARE-associated domain
VEPWIEGGPVLESFGVLLPYLERYSYPGLFGLLIACSFGFPFSKSLCLLAAGVLASRGIGNLGGFLLVGTAGMVTADGLYYLLGFLGGQRILGWSFFDRRGFRHRLREAEHRYRKQGWWAVFGARFTPFVRSVIFFVAGLSRMPPQRFFLADVLSALIYVPVLCLAGYLCSENRDLLLRHVRESEYLLAVLVAGAIAVLIGWEVWKRKRARPPGGG